MIEWFNEVIWFWVFAIALILSMGHWNKVSGNIVYIVVIVIAAVTLLLLYAGIQPRIVG